MKTKFKIIETPDYVLAVSLKPSKKGQLCYDITDDTIFTKKYDSIPHPLTNDNPVNENNYLPIIAYQPKNNAPELDLPLLPEMIVGDDVEDNPKIHDWVQEVILKEGKNWNDQDALEPVYYGIVKGYKAATKVYSEDDLIRVAIHCWNIASRPEYGKTYNVNEIALNYIQSLKQPKWFVAEMEEQIPEGFTFGLHGNDEPPTEWVLKTTTINGKTYLVGKFVNA
jgi:hypothetical protein